jgi:hypothetical protein
MPQLAARPWPPSVSSILPVLCSTSRRRTTQITVQHWRIRWGERVFVNTQARWHCDEGDHAPMSPRRCHGRARTSAVARLWRDKPRAPRRAAECPPYRAVPGRFCPAIALIKTLQTTSRRPPFLDTPLSRVGQDVGTARARLLPYCLREGCVGLPGSGHDAVIDPPFEAVEVEQRQAVGRGFRQSRYPDRLEFVIVL